MILLIARGRGNLSDLADYTKFKLKNGDELNELLQNKDNLFIIGCNKCFKEFTAVDETECYDFTKIAYSLGKTVVGCTIVDFLCNETLTRKKLVSLIPSASENIFVTACGLGIQTVAAISELPVYAACDSLSSDGRHGLSLPGFADGPAPAVLNPFSADQATLSQIAVPPYVFPQTTSGKLCGACGQCYLNLTGGICPVVDCAKSLVNGQCGGSKAGKCETDKNKNCAWGQIYEKLDAQNRASMLAAQPVQLRDYSKNNHKFVNNYVKSIREKRLNGYYGGIHPTECKEFSEHLPLIKFPLPGTVVIPLSQHAGAHAKPIVSVGDNVKTGQKIGEAGGFISGNIHASVSGSVSAIEPRRHPNTGLDVLSVVIDSDGIDQTHESVKPNECWEILTPDEITAIIQEKGIVGMGGAGFPASVKLKSPKPIDTVLLNGCECEPFLTADHRVMLEYPDEVISGLRILLKVTGALSGIIVIEDNKPGAIELIQSKTSEIPGIHVLAVKTKYPQGAEKMLIKRALGRSVPSGGLPLDAGVIVSNVSTAKAISDAVIRGLPLTERVVTVTGKKIKQPANYLVRIGTSVKEIIDHCGGLTDGETTVKLGGPMMGFELNDLNVPVIKGTNGIIAIDKVVSEPSPCIRCGRCVDVCPMELLPLYYPQYAAKSDWEGMNEKAVRDCIECGCCDFICSSRIPIRESIKLGKRAIAAAAAQAKV